MTVIYSNIEEQKNSTITSEPYKRLTEEYRRIKDQGDIDGHEI